MTTRKLILWDPAFIQACRNDNTLGNNPKNEAIRFIQATSLKYGAGILDEAMIKKITKTQSDYFRREKAKARRRKR